MENEGSERKVVVSEGMEANVFTLSTLWTLALQTQL